MLVVDASVLFEVVADTPLAEVARLRMSADGDLAAPHIVDVEVFGVVRRYYLEQRLDKTAAAQAVDDLRDWPGERYGHRALMARAWDIRHDVRGWDAMYVALAEALDATLLTRDARLAAARGPRCAIEVVG